MNQYGGLWSSEEIMKTELEKQSTDHHRIMTVKNQLRVRKIILQQKANKDLLAFSCVMNLGFLELYLCVT